MCSWRDTAFVHGLGDYRDNSLMASSIVKSFYYMLEWHLIFGIYYLSTEYFEICRIQLDNLSYLHSKRRWCDEIVKKPIIRPSAMGSCWTTGEAIFHPKRPIEESSIFCISAQLYLHSRPIIAENSSVFPSHHHLHFYKYYISFF